MFIFIFAVTVLIFIFIIFYISKQYEKMIADVFKLTDVDKKYIKILMRSGRINQGEQSENDLYTLQKLDEDEWIIPLDDGALIRGESTSALMRVLGKSSYPN
ncbi:hypothetical protein L5L78_08550 [Shewanella sp. SM34]|uniref:hypothetical protein n=1 Tax=unclassified Shewanella TaxID=196818 RepID=UPI0021D99310|nr:MULTISPECIES: hypothetical protein [unclassified Shewanella]MCU8056250.1 hypothetical protein [Shewanella sp. SM35]MCU8065184.1 hypothetical protein [Shewanella sp. SM34]